MICNLETNKPVEILYDRTTETFEKWLQNHKNIKIVTRDRATSYSIALNNIVPDALQIADRFYIIKNLCSYVKETMDLHYRNGFMLKEEKQILEGIDKETNIITNESGSKLITKAFLRKLQIIKKVRNLYSKGLSISTINRKMDLDWRTTKKYINLNDLPKGISKIYKSSILDQFNDEVATYINNSLSSVKIFERLKEKGYTGSYFLVNALVKKFKNSKTQNPTNNIDKYCKIDRLDLIKLL